MWVSDKLKSMERSAASAIMISAQETAVYVGHAVQNLLALMVGGLVLALSVALRTVGCSLFQAWDWAMEQSGRKRIILDRENKEPYLVRYYLLFRNRQPSFPFNVFIHRFIKGDDDHIHDHPWGYFTYILSGGYHETVCQADTQMTYWRAPGFCQKVASKHRHKISLDLEAPACWTLFVPFRRSRNWGFYQKSEHGESVWIEANEYLRKQSIRTCDKPGGCTDENSESDEDMGVCVPNAEPAAVNPAEFFRLRASEFGVDVASIGEDGLPTLDTEGAALTKSAINKLRKSLSEYTKEHESSNEVSNQECCQLRTRSRTQRAKKDA